MALDTVNSLVTLEDAKVWLGIKASQTEDDAQIENLIDSVSWQFNSYTNRLLKARDITGVYDGDGSLCLFVPTYPINSITSIHIDSDRTFGDDTLVDSTTYVYYDNGRIQTDSSSFSKTAQANQIVYNGGFTVIPYDLQVAVKDQIKWLYRRHINNQEGITTETVINGSVTVTEDGEILTTALEVLKRYRSWDHR